MRRYCAGIDLGTTNTVAAIWEEGAKAPRILQLQQPGPSGPVSDDLLPSSVFLPNEQGVITVGHEARARHRMGQAEVVTSVKRSMGRRWSTRRGDRVWTPEEVSACILAAVKGELHRAMGHGPELVVVTVPASFGTEARRATLRAARIAGFDGARLELLDEPTAALLTEAWGGQRPFTAAEQRLVMIDIGGGTLDVSLLRVERQDATIVADVEGTSRYTTLAGDDFDLQIAGYLLMKYQRDRGRAYDDCTDEARKRDLCAELLVAAEELKMALSDAHAEDPDPAAFARMRRTRFVQSTVDGAPWEASLDLQDLQLALRDLFEDHGARPERLDAPSFFTPISQCLESARRITGRPVALPAGVDQVYVAGGSARLPMVQMAVRRKFAREARVVDEPKLAVARGAAWYAGARLAEHFPTPNQLVLRQRMYDDLFLQTADGSFKLLLPASTIVPTPRPVVHEVRTSRPDRYLDLAFFVGSITPEGGEPAASEVPGLDVTTPDMQLSPLARRRVDFHEVLPADHPVTIRVSVTHNREIGFAFDTEHRGTRCHGTVAVSAGFGWVGEEVRQVPPVNTTAARSSR